MWQLCDDTHLILDGEVRVYRRERSKRWQAAFVVDVHTIRISTGKRDLAEAKEYARDMFLEYKFCYKSGLPVVTKKFLIKAMRKHGSPKIITTDKLGSYGAVFREIGIADKQLCGGRSNNRCKNSHLPFRRRERAMQLFKTAATFQRFISYHSQTDNHFNHESHLENRQTYKQKRTTALIEWFQICAS